MNQTICRHEHTGSRVSCCRRRGTPFRPCGREVTHGATSLSRQIRQLETELGVPLFHRTKRNVQLTDAGRVFLDDARRTLDQAQHAIRAAQRAHKGEIGRLVVGFVNAATVGILPDIQRVFREYFDLPCH